MSFSTAILPDNVKNMKIIIGLSGGVDSAVSAYLLKKAGADVTGVYIQCWDFKADGCKAEEDRSYAVQTAGDLGIKFIHLDFRIPYKEKVMEYFYSEYEQGRTPNPDIMCNKEIKFGLFYKWAEDNGYDYISTGHYARTEHVGNKYSLLKGIDPSKDQSYFLYTLKENQLKKILFPVGNMLKSEVKKIASEMLLPPRDRPESMGICFIGEVDIKDFLMKRIKPLKGNVLDISGEVIGEHDGAWFYTIGQRHGFRLSKYFGEPLYVISKDVVNNTLIVGPEKAIYRNNFEVNNVHWINECLEDREAIKVRIRHLGKLYDCILDTGDKNVKVSLFQDAFGIAPGQSAVFYKDDLVLGGGIIS